MGKGGKANNKSYKKSSKRSFKGKRRFKNSKSKPNHKNNAVKQIMRNKQSEEILKRQQIAEMKFKNIQHEMSESDSEHPDEIDNFQNLLQSIKKPNNDDDDDMSAEGSDSDNASDSASVDIDAESGNESVETVGEKNEETLDTNFLEESLVNDLDRNIHSEQESENEEEQEPELCIDAFVKNFNFDLDPTILQVMSSTDIIPAKSTSTCWPALGNLVSEIPIRSTSNDSAKSKKSLLEDEEVYAHEGVAPTLKKLENEFSIKEQILKNVSKTNIETIDNFNDTQMMTPLQKELLSAITNYQDFYFPQRTFQNEAEIKISYCIHLINHVLKSRQQVLNNNAKLTKLKAEKKDATFIDDIQDQGFVRPKVLIILPFRESAFRLVNILNLLLLNNPSGAINYKRFVDEYTGETLHFPTKNSKPEDYEKIFAGNTDDTFRIGISITRSSMKLYSPFYSSDIILASPLGLRLIIGTPGKTEYDFLSSIELMILDQMEILLAQNWDHILYIFEHLHLQPKERQNIDFLRVRSWNLNGWSKLYCQTLLFSSLDLPEFRSLHNNKCKNYRGKVKVQNAPATASGTIRHVVLQIPQVFHRIEVNTLESSFDNRFHYFVNEILPQLKFASMAHCMIYVPSFFDYVRLRNYFKKEEINFTQVCEYTKENKISRARTLFYHGGAHFMLYSERAHFFRRFKIKGIKHVVMYQPPAWPNFYSEIINLMQDGNQNPRDNVVTARSVTVLYTKFDILKLLPILGSENVKKVVNSTKSTHMFANNE